MESKQKFPMDVLTKSLRCCATGFCDGCPLEGFTLEECNAANIQAAEMLEMYEILLSTFDLNDLGE